jgi:hypothetical protein
MHAGSRLKQKVRASEEAHTCIYPWLITCRLAALFLKARNSNVGVVPRTTGRGV